MLVNGLHRGTEEAQCDFVGGGWRSNHWLCHSGPLDPARSTLAPWYLKSLTPFRWVPPVVVRGECSYWMSEVITLVFLVHCDSSLFEIFWLLAPHVQVCEGLGTFLRGQGETKTLLWSSESIPELGVQDEEEPDEGVSLRNPGQDVKLIAS